MAAGQITWEQFITSNNDARGVRYKFEDLCRQLFTNEFLANNKVNRFMHSNPNNPGVESEPILDEQNNRYIGYQAKFFDNAADYCQIKESAEKAVKHYAGQLDCIYLFCNKALTTTCQSYKAIDKLLSDAGIALVPITDTTILDLVRKYPTLSKYYFDDHNITHEWFLGKAKEAVSILGERYNAEFNVDTEASKNLSVFFQDVNSISYFNKKKASLIEEISASRWELEGYYSYAREIHEFVAAIPDIDSDSIHEVEFWNENIHSKFKVQIQEIETKIDNLQSSLEEIGDTNLDKSSQYRNTLARLTKLLILFNRLNVTDFEKELLKSSILVVTGQAGIGKTQIFANETFEILKENGNALLIVGSDYLSDRNILEQLKDNLRLSFSFEDLVDILEAIGESERRIIPILVDALNESWKPRLWKSALPLIYNKVCDKKYVRVAISLRNEYKKEIIPERFLESDGVMEMEHQGFRGNSIEAAQKFLGHYGIPFTPIHMFTNSIDNPLFLTLYCRTYQGDEVGLPMLYDRLLEQANDKIYAKLEDALSSAGYDSSDNLVSTIVETIAKEILVSGNRHFEKNYVEAMSLWKSLGITARPFISQLIKENILQSYESDGKEYICFAYDQMNDYYPANVIMTQYHTEKEIRECLINNVLGIQDGEIKNWGNEELFVNACALFAAKFHKECIDLLEMIIDESDREYIFKTYIESLEWRTEIYLSLEDIMNYCNKYYIDPSTVWNSFIANSVKPSHLMNADALHSLLKRYPLNKRDYLWTEFINGRSADDDRVVQLVELYNKGEGLQVSNEEQIRLLLVLFSWMLTASNRWLRDTTSKAMIELLKEHFEFSEYLLDLFSDVNDPYVIQRLYGIVFGACTKRNEENKEVFKSLVNFVYQNIFCQDIVYPDILLRDYARLIIDRFISEYPDDKLKLDLNKIRPPYRSVSIPEVEDQKYSDKDFEGGEFYIQHSMRFEGIGMYGDFGRYVFQSAVRNFDVDDYKIFNYSMHFILNELGYKNELFDEYDKFVSRFSYDRHRTLKTERIGKKYQWIAMYNILARISDYYPMKDRYSTDEKTLPYDGPYEPYVKDFDPTLNCNYLFDVNAPFFAQISEHLKEAILENSEQKKGLSFNENKWIQSNTIFFDNQKCDLILKDEDGKQWIVLSKYADTGRDDLAHDKLMAWNWLYGYFVSDDQLAVLKEYAGKKVYLLSSEVTSIPETYTLYNREYPWSSGSKPIQEWQYREVEIATGETRTVSHTIEEPDFSILEKLLAKYNGESAEDEEQEEDANEDWSIPVVPKTYTREEPVTVELGKILNTTQNLLWEEEFDASKEETLSYSHPCIELISCLKLRQRIYDGYYYSPEGELVAFDTDLTKQKAGFVIRKDALDNFLSKKKLHLVWFVNAAKEIHDKTLMIANYTDWTGLLEYTGEKVEGEYYIAESKD